MMDLFRQEVENNCAVMSANLLALEKEPANQEVLAELMRAAHSLKGAGRIMDLKVIVGLTHAMEDLFVSAQNEKVSLGADNIDLLLKGVDKLGGIINITDEEIESWLAGQEPEMEELQKSYIALAAGEVAVKEPVARNEQSVEQPGETLPGKEEDGEEVPDEAVHEDPVAKSNRKAAKGRVKKVFSNDLSSMSMMDLFRQEAEIHCATLTDNLLALDKDAGDSEALAALMRAAHSIKGAARIIDLHIVVGLAHGMEDVFVAAQDGEIVLDQDQVDLLLNATDMFTDIADQNDSELEAWFAEFTKPIKDLENKFKKLAAGRKVTTSPKQSGRSQPPVAARSKPVKTVKEKELKEIPNQTKKPPATELVNEPKPAKEEEVGKLADRFLRVTAEGMNRLMGFAGEVQVEARWLPSFTRKIQLLKHRQDDIHRLLDIFKGNIGAGTSEELSRSSLKNLIAKMDLCRNLGNEILAEAEDHSRRATEISHRLYQEVLANRMRPFGDGTIAFPRMVRDIARELGKKVEFEILGAETLVDRDILEKIEAPLNHLIRNALDHGVELPEKRIEAGKSETGIIRLQARHSAGLLNIVVSDDGPGIDIEKLRRTVVSKRLISEDVAKQLRKTELLEFIFLPNFSTRDSVSKVSGRGVGMDVVHRAVHEVRGVIRTNTELGVGTSFELQLPITLSVMRTLLVEISDEVYAFPLVAIDNVVSLQEEVKEVEGRQYINFNNERIGLVFASQVLEKEARKIPQDDEELLIVIISDLYNRYGLIVDKFLGIHDLVIQPLDRRLKKVQDINAVAILEDGTPVLIVDVEDMVRSINALISGNRLRRIDTDDLQSERTFKRILVVDDSITVREVERKMLANKGYDVKTAVDGLDGWNILRSEEFDLVVSDVDMPRMDGIEFISQIRRDSRYESMPVIIVSYKDREEDRNRGLEAGADYYLTKGSFQDETLVRTVEELIGAPQKKELNRL